MKRSGLLRILFLTFVIFLTCFCLVACGDQGDEGGVDEHVCVFDNIDTNIKYRKERASCTEKAIYYYSCDCGKTGTNTFEYGFPLGHDYSDFVNLKNGQHVKVCNNDLSHRIVYNCIGGYATCTQKAVCSVCNTEYGDFGEHVYNRQEISSEYFKSQATCKTPSLYYYSCQCGAKGTETFEVGEILEHSFINYVFDNNADYDNNGTKTAYCENGCGEKDTVIVDGTMISDISFIIGESKNLNRYSITIKGIRENAVLSYFDFNDFENRLVISSEVNLSGREFSDYFEYVDTIIVDNVGRIENFSIISKFVLFSVYFSKDLEYVCDYAFSYTPASGKFFGSHRLAMYFEGDFPELQSQDALNFEYFTSIVIYHNEEAEGFTRNYDFDKAITYKIIGEDEVIPSVEIDKLAYDFHNESIRLATEMFEDAIEKNKVLPFLFPIASLDGYKEIKEFTLALTKDCDTETEKARVIFDWVCYNIKYDINALSFSCDQVFEYKKAVCAGYAFIMHDMLAAVGIMSVYVHGLTNFFNMDFTSANFFSEEGYTMDQQHAWSIAYIDKKAVAFDATWGAYDFKTPIVNGVYRIAMDVEAFGVMPNGYSPRDFKTGLFELDGNLYYFTDYGELNTSSVTIGYNMAYNIQTENKSNKSDLTYNGDEEIALWSIYRDGVISFKSSGIPLFYALPNGKVVMYTDMIKFIEFENSEYGEDYEIQGGESSTVVNGVIYYFKDGKYSAISCSSNAEEISIPSSIKGYPVTHIDLNCFNGLTNLRKVIIPGSVKVIDQGAFGNCKNLKEVVFNEGLEKILSSAFSGVGLESVTLPNSLIEIDQLTFYNCPNLKQATLGKSLRIFYGNSFYNCPKLERIDIQNNQTYTSENGVIFNKDYSVLIKYPTGATRQHYTVPTSVKTIEASAFDSVKNLTKITFNEGLKTIGTYAFQNCSNIEELIFPQSIETIEQQAFWGLEKIKKVTIGGKITGISNDCFAFCSSLEEVVILEGVRQIENFAFTNCSNLKKIVLPKSLVSVGQYSFQLCDSISEVVYLGSLADKNRIIVGEGNETLLSANWIYNG